MRSAVFVLGLVFALGSCDRSNHAGPLDDVYGDLAVETCLPRRPGQAATFADVYVENPTDGTMTLTGLAFATTDGATLLGAVISSPDLPLVAAGRGYPPGGVPDDVWAETRPLAGATVDADQQLISIGLRLDDARGEVKNILLAYEVDGDSYEVEINRTYRLMASC
jgi:hypothetical protein